MGLHFIGKRIVTLWAENPLALSFAPTDIGVPFSRPTTVVYPEVRLTHGVPLSLVSASAAMDIFTR
jgi:hypothetical protein